MTDASTLLSLADRVEGLKGPDREVDGLICAALDPNRQTIVGEKPGRFPRDPIYEPITLVMERIGGKDGADYIGAASYTASLDSAMTLVPEGSNFLVDRIGSECEAMINHTPFTKTAFLANNAATPALALCAASLRARALAAQVTV